MIKINVETYCESCPHFEAEQSTDCATAMNGQTVFVEHIIKCKNKYKCKRIYNYLEQYKINEGS